jgi:hypothetical protein
LGNDTVGFVYHTDTSGAVLGAIPVPTTGIAWNGSNLYFSSAAGITDRRSADGSMVLGSFAVPLMGSPSEDLAWDPSRNRLWRIDHWMPHLLRIDPSTGLADASFPLSTIDPGGPLTPLGGLGIAYDSRRDLLYLSFCSAGCSAFLPGLIETYDPATGAYLGVLTRPGFATGGLAYDALTDTLWVGDNQRIVNIDLAGNELSSFFKPGGSGFTDGLEFVPSSVPEPATLLLLGSGLVGLRPWRRRRQ